MGTRHVPGSADSTTPVKPAEPAPVPGGPYAGKPLDGSQYHDVIDEQRYADQRPTPEEQKPRFSYLHKREEPRRGKARK